MLYVVSLVSVKQSSYIPSCETNRPWSFIGVLDEVVGCIVAIILNMHGPVEEILGI